MKLEFCREISKKKKKKLISYISYIKIRTAGADFFHADRRTDRTERRTDTTKLIVAFRNFANAPKIYAQCHISPILWLDTTTNHLIQFWSWSDTCLL
jgi:hypothetical protein